MRWSPLLLLSLCACAASSSDPISTTSTPANSPIELPAPSTPPAADTAPATPDEPPPATGTATLRENRDRLIDTLATKKETSRCPLWTGLTDTQRGVFLTISDLLGKRSFLSNAPATPRAGADLEMALDHVTQVYEIRDSNGSNGGTANNRIWIQVDAKLIAALRAVGSGLPEWATSKDFGGPHEPFDASLETISGQPRGQTHFWSGDAKAKPLARPGVEGINDPHIVEIDIDYNLIHDSNPEASYFPNGKGRDYYAKVWTPKGVGGSPELDYVPTGCTK